MLAQLPEITPTYGGLRGSAVLQPTAVTPTIEKIISLYLPPVVGKAIYSFTLWCLM